MSGAGDLFGANGIALQFLLWGVFMQLLGPILEPVTRSIGNRVNAADPNAPLSPADAADLVLRGHLSRDDGATIAAKSGIDGAAFDLLVADAGEPPGVMDMLSLYRRGLIAWDGDSAVGPGMVEAIRQSRLRDQWAGAIRALATHPISESDAVDAAVANQIPREQAQRIAEQNGIDAEAFAILLHTRGRPPGIEQVIEMARRGLVPATGTGPDVTSLEQAVAESDLKDKWNNVIQGLLEYHPPPRTITALERAGAITTAQATDLYRKAGLSAEMAAAYSATATHEKLAPTKHLARTTYQELYSAKVIPRDEAHRLIAALGYEAHEVDFILTLLDMQREIKVRNAAIGKIGSLFVARRIDAGTAAAALEHYGVEATERDELMQLWQLELDATVRIPSEAQIASAAYYKIITPDAAVAELQLLGYSAYDAWLIVSVRLHGPAGPEPPRARQL